MDAAASIGAWDRVVELANDVLAVDPPNQRAASMIERAKHERSLPGGQRAFVSLIFADIVQSTDMAEVAEPEVIQDVFVLYRRVAAETIEELGGRVLQFQGDGVVACFGYPAAHEDDARRAVMAALRLIERMAHAAIELHRRHGIEPAIRVGVHSGTVVVAGLASGVIDGSAISGSAPNVAARLQGEAEPGTVVISDTTRQLVEPHFELKPIGTRSLKGIARPMELHQVVRSNLAVPPPGRGLPGSVALVGREGQSRLLRFTWKRLVHGAEGAAVPEGAVAVVRGAAGIGKSALADDLAAHVHLEGGTVLEANCSPYHGNVALWPVGRMLEQLLGFYPDQPPEERLAELVARLGDAGLDCGHRGPAGPAARTRHRRAVVAPAGGRTRPPPTDAPRPGRLARPHGSVNADPGVGRGPPLGRPDHGRAVGAPGDRARPEHDDPDHEPAPARCAVGVVGPRHRAGAAQGEGGGAAGRRAD